MRSSAPAAPAIYVRWSTEEQGSGTTLEEQKQTCLGFLADRAWPVRQEMIFIDDGYSAGSLERPAMKALRKAVHAGEVDAVVVYKLDRLTRNIVDAVDLVLKEWEGRCALVSVTQSAIDTTNALGRQFFTLMASFAEFEREMIRDRTLSGKRRRAQQGRNPGFRPPYGYRLGETPGSIEVDEEKAAVVRRIFELYATGIGTVAAAHRLNKEAVPSPGGARGWQDRTVRYMLDNPLYIGRLEYGKTSVNSPQKKAVVGRHKTIHRAPRHAVVPEAVPAIIPLELWNTVRAVMDQRRIASGFNRRAASSSFLLSGILRCRCGYAYAGVRARGVSYYRCRGGPGTCNAGIIQCSLLDEIVLDAVRKQLRSRMGQGVAEAAVARAEAARQSLEATVANLKGALADLQKQRTKARKDYMAGDLSARLYSELTEELDHREAEMKASLQEAERDLANPVAGGPDAAWMAEHMEQLMSDAWGDLDMGQKKHTLRLFVPRLVAYRERGASKADLEMTVATMDTTSSLPVTFQWDPGIKARKEPGA